MSLCRKPHSLIMARDPSALNEKSIMAPPTWVEKTIRGQLFSLSLMRHPGMYCLLVTARSLRFNSNWEESISASAPLPKHCGFYFVFQGKFLWSYPSFACLPRLPNNFSPERTLASGTETGESCPVPKAICFLQAPRKEGSRGSLFRASTDDKAAVEV